MQLLRLTALLIFSLLATTLPAFANQANAINEQPYRLILKLKQSNLTANSLRAKTMEISGVAADEAKPMANGAFVLTLSKNDINQKALSQQQHSTQTLATILKRLNNHPAIDYAVEDIKLQAHSFTHEEQWDEFMPPAGVDSGSAWAITKGSPEVVVAVVDTGIVQHNDLDANILPGYSFVTSRADATDLGLGTGYHGTHVAGTIAANGNLLGMAPHAKILPIQVLGDGGWGHTSDIINGLYWAAGENIPGVTPNLHPAKIINLSLGGYGACSAVWQDAIEHLTQLGVTIVASAGNSNNDSLNYHPAGCAGVITVAATNKQGKRAYYSNYGDSVDIAAPGGEITGFDKSGGILSTIKFGYKSYQGTSMASPHVAGIIALLQSVNPNLDQDEILNIIQQTASPFPEGDDEKSCVGLESCGAGIINAGAAVREARDRI